MEVTIQDLTPINWSEAEYIVVAGGKIIKGEADKKWGTFSFESDGSNGLKGERITLRYTTLDLLGVKPYKLVVKTYTYDEALLLDGVYSRISEFQHNEATMTVRNGEVNFHSAWVNLKWRKSLIYKKIG